MAAAAGLAVLMMPAAVVHQRGGSTLRPGPAGLGHPRGPLDRPLRRPNPARRCPVAGEPTARAGLRRRCATRDVPLHRDRDGAHARVRRTGVRGTLDAFSATELRQHPFSGASLICSPTRMSRATTLDWRPSPLRRR
ncbi:hypothetical protein [Streptomyces sp. NPDC001843]|uniref:hypothetical protein n=1 Tax=Streptomyces sp. NPDC001843 TaxID=3364617 RepID=UPI0036A17F77